jgi:hypothetical protein
VIRLIASLLFLVHVCFAFADAPDEATQQQILKTAQSYAEQYHRQIPDFICSQTVRRYSAKKDRDKWKLEDTFLATMGYRDGHDRRVVLSRNNKPISGEKQPHGFWTHGEFGNLLQRVFSENARTSFQFDKWEKEGDSELAVFHYETGSDFSGLRLSVGAASAWVPYRGSISIEPKTGRIYHVASEASNIPPGFPVKAMTVRLDYKPVPLNDTEYLLPAVADGTITLQDHRIRNEIEFSEYRKFDAQSSIRFNETYPSNDHPPE